MSRCPSVCPSGTNLSSSFSQAVLQLFPRWRWNEVLLDIQASPSGRLKADFLFWFYLHMTPSLWEDVLEIQKEAKFIDNEDVYLSLVD